MDTEGEGEEGAEATQPSQALEISGSPSLPQIPQGPKRRIPAHVEWTDGWTDGWLVDTTDANRAGRYTGRQPGQQMCTCAAFFRTSPTRHMSVPPPTQPARQAGPVALEPSQAKPSELLGDEQRRSGLQLMCVCEWVGG
ncbi:hypothetical protein PLESTB_001229900 [Pleodorina starrii]|uniref:Uncharacterized protein n=1 Tax=Pleodorina starrii TaxID=330485 RepID=A0A9W6F5X3_9CHLO|nr:hypothetical protein PLESTM_000229900 [Pleodorina starrii]GLC57464.1 hypothetical protein PLESTB_001229900 [Pleodorina starrii]